MRGASLSVGTFACTPNAAATVTGAIFNGANLNDMCLDGVAFNGTSLLGASMLNEVVAGTTWNATICPDDEFDELRLCDRALLAVGGRHL